MGIYVWGTGCGASELIEAGLEPDKIAAFIDSFLSSDTFLGKPVLLPDQLDPDACSLLIVTTRHASAVADTCQSLGIPREKTLYLKNNTVLQDLNQGCTAASELDESIRKKLLPKQNIVPTPAALSDSLLPQRDLSNDYVRLATLELICRKLKDVPGAAAELGVYKGYFSRCINQLMPDRTLYLFDSFAGFSSDANASESFQAAHQNTAVEQVLAILPHPDKAIVKPGFFPESLQGMEDRFCLVSLDVDFYETTLEGLRWFWPRMVKGGCLMLHDWGSPKLPGVAQALSTYEKELGQKLPSVPLCDIGGTLILCK